MTEKNLDNWESLDSSIKRKRFATECSRRDPNLEKGWIITNITQTVLTVNDEKMFKFNFL